MAQPPYLAPGDRYNNGGGSCVLFWLDWLYRESAIAGIKQHHTQKNSPEKLAASKVVCHGIDIVLMLCYRHEELSYLWRRCEQLQ